VVIYQAILLLFYFTFINYMQCLQKALSTVNLDTLPDKGLRLEMQLSNLKNEYKETFKKYKQLNEKMPQQHTVTSNFNSLPVGQPQPYKRPGSEHTIELSYIHFYRLLM
jgi:hypothetical protein